MREDIIYQELCCQHLCQDSKKDIIIVVHDQLDFIKNCIDSLYLYTNNFHLYLWDNDSMNPTKEYLKEVERKNANVTLIRHEKNIGFIIPNNRLVELGTSPYIILLNSDTEVAQGWDLALLGWLQEHKNCAVVGCQGGSLNADGMGYGGRVNGNVDYVCGWCMCIERRIYEKHGLFDEKNLSFAYGEDSDLSLRLREAGFEIHALHIKLIKHFGNVTSLEVNREIDMSVTFRSNHDYIKNRWRNYLANERVELKKSLNFDILGLGTVEPKSGEIYGNL